MNDYLIALIFFVIALLYSSIGFGGGSSYLAILSLLLADFFEIRTTALVLNVLVVGLSTIFYIRNHHFNWRLFWPFVVFSIPAAFVGAQLRISERAFFVILGSGLVLSAFTMLYQQFRVKQREKKLNDTMRAGVGVGIGMLSGMAGIGGGIFLSPTLHLFKWENAKTIAALSSFFILSNSLAGLVGIGISGSFVMDWEFSFKIIFAVLIGGLLGSHMSNNTFELKHIRVLTALLVGYVGFRVLFLQLFEIQL